jgi:hypothetical protein
MQTVDTASKSDEAVGRRDVLKRGLVAGGLGAVIAGLGVTPVGAAGASLAAAEERTLVLDCACLGDTLRMLLAPGSHPPSDHAGSLFVVEGLIYPAGTIGGDGFDPAAALPIGRWFCRGWFVDSASRPQPGVLTTQEYVFGEITPKRLYPPDQLVSSGLEQTALPTFDPTQPAVRSVIGGTGRYAGASGMVIQHFAGHNTTTLGPAGVIGPAPNFRFEFQLR